MTETPTKPYLIRALYEWCVDNGYTPHLGVKTDSQTQVPSEYVRNGEIILNVSPTAVHRLQMGNETIEFSARFAGVARQISVPVGNVFALYARETGHGMTFDVDAPKAAAQARAEAEPVNSDAAGEPRPGVNLPAAPAPTALAPAGGKGAPSAEASGAQKPPPRGGGKPTLRRVK